MEGGRERERAGGRAGGRKGGRVGWMEESKAGGRDPFAFDDHPERALLRPLWRVRHPGREHEKVPRRDLHHLQLARLVGIPCFMNVFIFSLGSVVATSDVRRRFRIRYAPPPSFPPSRSLSFSLPLPLFRTHTLSRNRIPRKVVCGSNV